MDTKEILLESLEKFCTNTSGKCKNSFFENWFTKNGKTYNFIFKQNLFVTNLQFRELIDLIRLNVKKGSERPQINFMTTNEFIDLTSNIIESFIDEKALKNIREKNIDVSEIRSKLEIICKNYGSLFENIIVIDAFYTSCIVSVPNDLELNVQQICFQSGYIHSCGENIYTRNMKKAKYDAFVDRLETYLQDYKEPLNFIMYTHEDFPIKNKMYVNDFQKHGLDEIKFYLEKFYMQDISLIQVVEHLRNDTRLEGKIKIMGKAEAKQSHAEESIWMIIDRSIGSDLKYPGDKRYYICYKQMYINENPFHIFDEDKPGWINPVTIPHTLVGAMINIGRGEWPNNVKERYRVIDPFVGSGTTGLEVLKYDDIDFWGGDKCEISQMIARMNLKFFAMDIKDLQYIQDLVLVYLEGLNAEKYRMIMKELNIKKGEEEEEEEKEKEIKSTLAQGIRFQLTNIRDQFKEEVIMVNFTSIINEISKTIKNAISSKNKTFFTEEKVEFIAQLFVLLTWRRYKHNESRYKKTDNFYLIRDSAEEFKGFLYRLLSYIHLRERSKDDIMDGNNEGRMVTYLGKYTRACTINSKFIYHNISGSASQIRDGIDVIDFLKSFEENKVDLIITDPPYGFNTAEEKKSFSELYIEFINAMVRVMDNGGQIIMCLPSVSYSGKTVNVFAQKEIVSRLFMIAAQENNMFIAENEGNFPKPREIFSFPFYWDSEKALRRDIVRFQFFRKN